ncbi:MAG: APC family permease, partial [Planctomycetaceae bacterium]|nr:APC family permease [Planctomycetaceae bacterium]
GATNSNMITGPRIYLAIARDGLIPSRLHRLHHRYRTPANTIIIQAVWTVVLILLFSFRNSDGTDADAGLSESQRHVQGMQYAFGGLTDSVICAGLIFYGMAVAAVYVLRKTRPNAERPYRTWGYPVTPALLLIAYTGVFVNMLAEQLTRTTFVLAFIAAGIIYYRIVAALLRKSLNRQ